MAGAVVAVWPSGKMMALATFVFTAASKPTASIRSAPVPLLVMVDQSVGDGNALKVIVPLPPGPTEMAALAPNGTQVVKSVSTNTMIFIRMSGGFATWPQNHGGDEQKASRRSMNP